MPNCHASRAWSGFLSTLSRDTRIIIRACDESMELVGFLNEFFGFRIGGYRRVHVIDHISFAATGIEVVRQSCNRRADGPMSTFKSHLMMSSPRSHAISGTGYGHLCRLECGIVCGGKSYEYDLTLPLQNVPLSELL
jgi:hypothetical protein